jgi:hypothetical protein
MEKAMSQAERVQLAGTPGTSVFSRLRAWCRRRNELDAMDPDELERIAEDVGTTAPVLRELVARGRNAASLLYERMHSLGLSREDVERVAPELMRDLERTCACCDQKGVCQRDLAVRPDNPAWQDYCPNAVGLTCVKVAKEPVAA